MGFLDKLWDDTVAGPRPENGLSKLRKYSSFSPRSSTSKGLEGWSGRSDGEGLTGGTRITRSLTIARPEENPTLENGSLPQSPAGSTPPVSPVFGKEESKRYRRYEKALLHIPTSEI